MLQGNRCEKCKKTVESTKAQHKQTKYCEHCAKKKKKDNTKDCRLPERRTTRMRRQMPEHHRSHLKRNNQPVLKHGRKEKEALTENNPPAKPSTAPAAQNQNTIFLSFIGFLFLLFLAMVSSEKTGSRFDVLNNTIKQLKLLVVDISGLAVIIVFSWQHIKHLLKDENKEKKDKDDDKQSVN